MNGGQVFFENEDILQDFLKIRKYNREGKEGKHMKKEIRTVVYDDELRIEAYRFEGTLS